MSLTTTQIRLPDLLLACPLESAANPHYEKGAADSRAWINSFNVFTDRKRAFFTLGYIELLASHVYPYAAYDAFRMACEFVNLLFTFDEFSDDQDGKEALTTGNIFLNAMKDPLWDNYSKFSRMTKEFRKRFASLAGPNTTVRFLKNWETYCAAVITEAELREKGRILDVDSFTNLRRENGAVSLCFGLIEACSGTDLPDEVFEDPTFMEIYWAALDFVCWSNDVYSYDMEQSRGINGSNIVTVLMHDKKMDLQSAVDYAGTYSKELMDRFINSQARLPSWGSSVDSQVVRFIQGLGCWIKGNLDWSFESQRYFGPKHMEIKNTLLVTLRPLERPEEVHSESDSE